MYTYVCIYKCISLCILRSPARQRVNPAQWRRRRGACARRQRARGETHFRVRICLEEIKRRARDSRAPPVEGGAGGCDARALSAQPTAVKALQITNCREVS